MAQIFYAFLSGVVSDNPLSSGATTVNGTAIANLPAVAGPDYMWMVLDPNGVNGLPEVVKVTAHTAAATSCTIVRGQQTSQGGAVAHSHPQNTVWVMAQTPADFDEFAFRKLTTTGDILYASAANTAGRLAIGSTGQVLSVASGVPSWVQMGHIASATTTSGQASIGTSPTDLTSMSVTFTAVAGRKYKISAAVSFAFNSGAAARVILAILESGTIVQVGVANISGGLFDTASTFVVRTPGAGSVTYKLQGSCDTGTVNTYAGVGNTPIIIVEDIGT